VTTNRAHRIAAPFSLLIRRSHDPPVTGCGYFALAVVQGPNLGREEIGWRGFLVPELFKTMGFTSAALFSGVVWACWHYPLLIWGDYNSGTPTWYGLTCFTVLVVSISLVMTQSSACLIAFPNTKNRIEYSNKANETKRP